MALVGNGILSLQRQKFSVSSLICTKVKVQNVVFCYSVIITEAFAQDRKVFI